MEAITIEQTGKKWKKLILIGAALIVSGLFLSAVVSTAAVILTVIGLIITIYAGIGKWWNHG